MKKIKLFASLFFGMLLISGCSDTVVDSTPVKVFVDTSIKESPIDGHWIGLLRDDIAETWFASWHIGVDGRQRILSGNVEVTSHQIQGFRPQSFPLQYVGSGVVVHPDLSWQTTVFVTTIWEVRGRLVHPDTMEVRISHFPEGLIIKFHRATSWPKK